MTDSLFGAGGFNTPPANPPFLSSVSPLELVSKNYHSGTVSFSQVSKQLKKQILRYIKYSLES